MNGWSVLVIDVRVLQQPSVLRGEIDDQFAILSIKSFVTYVGSALYTESTPLFT